MASPAVLRVFLDGEEQSIPLKQGSNVIGKNGGSADVRLHAASLSRRHALITVGDKAGDCTVEDLGSTNLSSVVVPGGQMQQMDTGRVYPLPHASTLVMGDVHATFSFSGASVGPPSSSGGLESKTRASTRASEKSSNQRRAGGRSAAANASALATQGRAAGIRAARRGSGPRGGNQVSLPAALTDYC
ncbi:hypothetical protein T484DRAFT_1799975 [Baffinella frigidus]|nr:hypothetical protein T484DRAFT_1799975 [Cryptophyta sp. CCMP2293]